MAIASSLMVIVQSNLVDLLFVTAQLACVISPLPSYRWQMTLYKQVLPLCKSILHLIAMVVNEVDFSNAPIDIGNGPMLSCRHCEPKTKNPPTLLRQWTLGPLYQLLTSFSPLFQCGLKVNVQENKTYNTSLQNKMLHPKPKEGHSIPASYKKMAPQQAATNYAPKNKSEETRNEVEACVLPANM